MNKKELEKKLKRLISKVFIANKKTSDIFHEARTLGLQDIVIKKAINDIKIGKSDDKILDKLEKETNIIEKKEIREQKKLADFEQQKMVDLARKEDNQI